MPAGQELPTDVKMPRFADVPRPSRDVFTALGKIAGVNVVFDPQFRPQPVTIDSQERLVGGGAPGGLIGPRRNFYRVTAQRTVTVSPTRQPSGRSTRRDRPPFFLSNADLKETMDLLRVVIDARRVAPVTATNTIVIKDTPERVAAAGKIIAAIDKARPRGRDRRRAPRSRSHAPQGVRVAARLARRSADWDQRQVDVNRDGLTLRDLRNLTQADVFLTNLPNSSTGC